MTVRSDLVTTDVAVAADRLRSGGVVAIPTETVYGLAAIADDETAVQRVFEIKGRPRDHPLIVHLASIEAVDGWTAGFAGPARVLADACWPGPLTLLVRRGPRTPDAVTGGRDTVGLRVPAHPLSQSLLAELGSGLAAPSANRFGRVSPTMARHVLDDLGSLLDPARDAVLDGGACPVGVESTIVDCTVDPPQLLRPGGIAAEDIAALLAGAIAPAAGPSRAAGMMASHYAPRCEVRLVGDVDASRVVSAALAAAGRRVEVLDRSDDLVAFARELYAELRAADERGLDVLVVVMPPARGLGHAIRDRLTKAAAARGTADVSSSGPRPDGPSRAR